MAAVLVHIDLDGARPHASSLQALAAGRVVASSWGATLYAAVIVHDPARRTEDGRLGLAAFRVPGELKAAYTAIEEESIAAANPSQRP